MGLICVCDVLLRLAYFGFGGCLVWLRLVNLCCVVVLLVLFKLFGLTLLVCADFGLFWLFGLFGVYLVCALVAWDLLLWLSVSGGWLALAWWFLFWWFCLVWVFVLV